MSTIKFSQWTLDVIDVDTEAEFWSQALGYEIRREADGSAHLRSPDGAHPGVWLQPTGETKTTKNRLHLDFAAVQPEVTIARLLELGAAHCDVGQTGREGFVVLADPEGNEFCVFTGPRS